MTNNSRKEIDNLDTFFTPGKLEVRSIDDSHEIFGYYAVFNSRSHQMRTKSGRPFVEEILPGAFDTTDFSKVEARFNHDTFLAAPPTVEHGVDNVGAWYRIKIDMEDVEHRMLLRRIQRGDVKGSSFVFTSPSAVDQEVHSGDVFLRRIKRFPEVLDFGPVVTPAYPATSAFSRSLDSQIDENFERLCAIREAEMTLQLMLS